MARARKKAGGKKGTIKVNFKDIETRTRVSKEGDYPLRCIEAVAGKSGAGNEQIEFTFEVSDGEFEGAKAWFYCTLDEKSLWKLHALLTAMGVDVPDDEMDIDLSELVDCEVVGVFTPDTYNGKRSFKMTDFCSMDDYEGDDKKSKGKKGKKSKSDDDDDDADAGKGKKGKKGKASKKEEPETPDYEDMDEDELRELYLERELGSKKEAKKLDEDELREALEEADEAATKSSKGGKKSKKDDDDEEDDEPKGKKSSKGKKSKKDDKPAKIDKSDVEDMDEDELQELIDEHDLDVDLDDYKKLPKKVAAVIEALDDEDLLEDDD